MTLNQKVKIQKWDGTHPKEDDINSVVKSMNEDGMELVDTDYQFQYTQTQTVPVHVLIMYFEDAESTSYESDFDFDNVTTEELEEELASELE